MNIKIEWREPQFEERCVSGQIWIGEEATVGKWVVGSVVQETGGPGRIGVWQQARVDLPGVGSDRMWYRDRERAKQAVEVLVREWVRGLELEERDGHD